MIKEVEEVKVKTPFNYKLAATILGGFALLFLLGFACYYFNIELMDLT